MSDPSAKILAGEREPVTPVYFNRTLADDSRRERVFGGAIFIHSGLRAIGGLGSWAEGLINDAFGDVP